MNKFKILSIIGLLTLTCATTASAREIGSFSNFRITTSYAKTSYLTKANDSNYVINLTLSQHLGGMRVKNVVTNSNGTPRSSENYSQVGHRHDYNTWAVPGYIYKLEMARENWWDGAAYIDGSWSPDYQ